MRSPPPARNRLTENRGSALLAVMCFATVLVLALTTFQALCTQTLKTSNRNTQSTHAFELAEMGMEIAVWSRTNALWTSAGGGIADWTFASGTASVTLSGSNYNFSNGVTGSVTISVTNYNVTTYNYATSLNPTSVVTSAGTVTLADGSTITRRLQATLKKTEPFSNAIAAAATSGTVQLLTGGQTIDSYTATPAYDPASPAVLPTTFTYDYGAIVAASSVTMQNNSTLNGYIATPPVSGTVVLSVTASAKLKGPSTAAGTNVDTTREITSPYQNVFDVANPAAGIGTALAEPSGDVNLGVAGTTTSYRANIGSSIPGYYNIQSGRLIVDGTAVNLIVPGYLYIQGSGQIIVKNGGTLRILLQGGGSIYYNGIDNQTLRPRNVSIIGTGTGGYNLWVWSSTKFYGTIYAPRHAVRVWGYNNTSEFFGAIVGSSVIIDPYNTTNTFKVHFDKDLKSTVFRDVTTPYAIQSGTLTEI